MKSNHKFLIGDKVYWKRHRRRGIVTSLSIGWNRPLAYVKIKDREMWIPEEDLSLVNWNPSVRR